MKAGDRVVWTQRDRVTGQPLRTVATAVRSIENVIRPDGSQHACAVLECERLVPLADLAKDDPQASGGRQSPDETDRSTNDAEIAAVRPPETVTRANQRSAKPNDFERSVSFEVDVKSLMEHAELVARNKLEAWAVTCWHAGQKSFGANPWKVGTVEHVAWSQGRAYKPLSVNLFSERLVAPADLANDPQASGGRQSHDETHDKPTIETRQTGIEEAVSRFHRNQGTDVPRSPEMHVCNVLAVDFLNVLVRAFFAGQRTETHAVRSMFQTVANAIRTIRPAHVVFAMDGGHEKRSRLLPQYKAHRPPAEPELIAQKQLGELALQLAGFQFIRIDGWEADDVLASIATAFSDTVILSADKDLLALPSQCCRCRVFHPWGAGKFATAETDLAIASHLVTDYLALCGDTSDGIPGVRGIGPKTAVQLLQEFDSLEGILSAATAGQIRGAVGTKLKEQRAIALLCREVVELNCRLPLPELVRWKPAADFQHQLQSKRLGAVAAIVDGLKDQRIARDAGDCSSDPGPAAIIERDPVPDLKPKRKGLFDAETE